MRRLVVEALALMLVLASMRMGLGQQAPHTASTDPNATHPPKTRPPQVKSKLEEMLADALKYNPDIRVAVAKVAEADAELNRTRLLVTQKVIDLHHGILSQKAAVEYEQKRFERMKKLAAQNSISSEILDEAQQKLTMAKAKLAELEAQIPAVLGKTTREEGKAALLPLSDVAVGQVRYYPLVGLAELVRTRGGDLELKVKDTQQTAGPMAERLRKALQTPIKVDYKNMPLADVLTDLMKKTPGLSIRCSPQTDLSISRLYFEEALPVSAVLQALEDDFNLRFLIREYGILVPDPHCPPPGALTLQEFLRQKPPGKEK